MPNYLTRHLTALSDFPLGRRFVRNGEHFEAGEVDAAYLVQIGQAKDRHQQAQEPTTQRAKPGPKPKVVTPPPVEPVKTVHAAPGVVNDMNLVTGLSALVPNQPKVAEAKPAPAKVEAKVEPKPEKVEVKPVDSKPAESKPAEVKPADTKADAAPKASGTN